MKLIAAVFIGIMLGAVAIFILEIAGHALYPPPPGIDRTDPEALASLIANAPAGALLMVVLAYAFGAFVGGLITHLIARSPKQRDALITGFILMLMGAYNLFTIPHPAWMVVLSLLTFLPFAFFGGWLVRKKPKTS